MARIKAVVVRVPGASHTYHNVGRVFTNVDGSVTIQRESNTPAIARHSNVTSVRYLRD